MGRLAKVAVELAREGASEAVGVWVKKKTTFTNYFLVATSLGTPHLILQQFHTLARCPLLESAMKMKCNQIKQRF